MKVFLDVGAYMPTYAHDADAGMDLRTPVAFIVPAHGDYTVDTGVHVQIPVGNVGFIKSKSGLNVNAGRSKRHSKPPNRRLDSASEESSSVSFEDGLQSDHT